MKGWLILLLGAFTCTGGGWLIPVGVLVMLIGWNYDSTIQ